MRFSHAALSVSDIARSSAFYEKVFGLTVRASSRSEDARADFVQLADASGCFVEIFQHDNTESDAMHPLDMSKTGIRHISFEVDAIEPVVEKALANGATLVREIRQGTTVKRNAFIADPDGIGIELLEL